MNEKDIMIKGMNKLIFFNFNYPDETEMIKYITRKEPYLYEHFVDKFNRLYKAFGCRVAMLSFYCELDLSFRREMLEYIIDNYNYEQKI